MFDGTGSLLFTTYVCMRLCLIVSMNWSHACRVTDSVMQGRLTIMFWLKAHQGQGEAMVTHASCDWYDLVKHALCSM